jgi:hypothetical protein
MRSARTVGGAVVLCGAVALAGCGGSSGSESGTGTTASAAKVTSLEVGELRCGGAPSAPVDVTWTTEGATAVEVQVDGFPSAPGGPSGTKTVVVACDGNTHEIFVTPRDAGSFGETETKEISG